MPVDMGQLKAAVKGKRRIGKPVRTHMTEFIISERRSASVARSADFPDVAPADVPTVSIFPSKNKRKLPAAAAGSSTAPATGEYYFDESSFSPSPRRSNAIRPFGEGDVSALLAARSSPIIFVSI